MVLTFPRISAPLLRSYSGIILASLKHCRTACKTSLLDSQRKSCAKNQAAISPGARQPTVTSNSDFAGSRSLCVLAQDPRWLLTSSLIVTLCPQLPLICERVSQHALDSQPWHLKSADRFCRTVLHLFYQYLFLVRLSCAALGRMSLTQPRRRSWWSLSQPC